MAISGDGNLYVYVLNVGQADTNVIITPNGHVIIIDAVRPAKLVQLLNDLGLRPGEEIDHILITHPHADHYSGANRLATTFKIKQATFAPFWHGYGTAPITYCGLIARLLNQDTPVHFLSGYSRYYPDGAFDGLGAAIDPNAPIMELLGPSNGLVKSLLRQKAFDTNHLSVLTRFAWRRFRMVFAADAQMENWASFDNEELLHNGCHVLKAPHHGSGNGTHWERLVKFNPEFVIVSAAPEDKHHLPDVIGSVVFTKYSRPETKKSPKIVAVTGHTGTVRITVHSNGKRQFHRFADSVNRPVNLMRAQKITWNANPTDWLTLARKRVNSI